MTIREIYTSCKRFSAFILACLSQQVWNWIWLSWTDPAQSPNSKHENFQTLLACPMEPMGLLLVKLIIISLVWIHTRHVMRRWTHLDPICWSSTYPKQPGTGPDHTASMAIFRHFLACPLEQMDCYWWNSSLSVLYGSILDMWCVDGVVWILCWS